MVASAERRLGSISPSGSENGQAPAQARESWSDWLGRHKVKILVGAAIVGVVLLTGGLALPAIAGVAAAGAIGAIFTATVIATTVGIAGAAMAGAGALILLVTAIVAYITRKPAEKVTGDQLALRALHEKLSKPFTDGELKEIKDAKQSSEKEALELAMAKFEARLQGTRLTLKNERAPPPRPTRDGEVCFIYRLHDKGWNIAAGSVTFDLDYNPTQVRIHGVGF